MAKKKTEKKVTKIPTNEKNPNEMTHEELVEQNEMLRKKILEAANMIAALKTTIVTQSMQLSGVAKQG